MIELNTMGFIMLIEIEDDKMYSFYRYHQTQNLGCNIVELKTAEQADHDCFTLNTDLLPYTNPYTHGRWIFNQATAQSTLEEWEFARTDVKAAIAVRML